MAIAPGEKSSPSIADKVGNEDDKGTLDSDQRGFELFFISIQSSLTLVSVTDCVDLVHDGLES
jgi:hypothetical protein